LTPPWRIWRKGFTINSNWRITGFNLKAQEITGFKRDEVLERPCWEIFNADRCQTDCPLKGTLEDGVTRVDQDVRVVNKSGRPLTLLVNTAVIKNKRGITVGAVETFRSLAPGKVGSPLEREIIGHSPAIREVLALLPDVAASAQAHQGAPAELALQGSKLIKASLAGLKTLKAPT